MGLRQACRRGDSGYRRRGGDRSYAGSRELLIYSYRMIQTLSDLKTVRFNEQADGVIILDQTLLPGKEAYLTLTTAEEIWDAISSAVVRVRYASLPGSRVFVQNDPPFPLAPVNARIIRYEYINSSRDPA